MAVDEIPQGLKEYQYVVWGRNKNELKQPFGFRNGCFMAAAWQKHTISFDEAMRLVKQGRAQGIGFVFNRCDIIGVDLDNVFINGKLIPEALDIVTRLNSYTEYSMSGNGLHIFVYAPGVDLLQGLSKGKTEYKFPGYPPIVDKDGNEKSHKVEYYLSSGYIAVTGHLYNEGSNVMEDRSKSIQAVYSQYSNSSPPTVETTLGWVKPAITFDEAIKTNKHLMDLWNGERPIPGDESANDLALLNYIAYFFGYDVEMIEQKFKESPHYLKKDDEHKTKWDERADYSQRTIKKAIEGLTYLSSGFIDPNSNKSLYRLDEQGNGYLFADSIKNCHRYCPDLPSWMCFDGTRWIKDDFYIHEKARAFSNYMFSIKPQLGELSTAQINNICSLTKVTRRINLVRDAQTAPQLQLNQSQMDTNPDLFNCLNGTLNLSAMAFFPHKPNDMLCKISRVEYNPEAKPALWNKTLDELFPQKKEIIRYLQKVLGYAITGKPVEERFFIFYGATTRNGKGTVVGTVIHLLGDYAVTAQPELLALKKFKNSSNPRDDLARLMGTRFVNVNEPERGMALDESLVKAMTGRDFITARKLYHSGFDFKPQFTIVMNTNHLPYISDASIFTSGRIAVIPFERHFTEKERDNTLKDRLCEPAELSGILNWLLEGLRLYRMEGLKPPVEVRKAIDSYMLESDNVQLFLNERTEKAVDGKEAIRDLFRSFREWCIVYGFETGSIDSFSTNLKSKGYKQKVQRIHGSNPISCFSGIRLVLKPP